MDHKKNNVEIEILKTILKNSPDSIFLHNLNGDLIYANKTAPLSKGDTKNEFITEKFDELINITKNNILNHYNDLIEKGSLCFEASHLCKDGSNINVAVDSNIIESKDDSLVLSITRNVDLNESEDDSIYYGFLKDTKIGIMIENLGLITHLNHNLCDLLGYDKEELLGHDYIDFFNGIQEFSILDEIVKVKNGGKSTLTSHLKRKDGSSLLSLTTISPLYNSEEEYIGNLSLHREITKFK